MAKRRLTQHQSARIAKRRRAFRLDNTISVSGELGPEQPGLVISHYGTQADIENPDTGEVTRCHLRANLGDIVAGDRVIWQATPGAGVVVAVAPRHTALCRPDSYGKLRLAAANVTRALITVAPEPEAHANLIDRYLVVAENLQLEAVLLVNKLDLLDDAHRMHDLLDTYRALDYPIFNVSARCGTGLPALREFLSDGTSVFVGQSGVGKSSIIQALLPEENIKIGDLSEQVRKGRHTTTHARLYHFPDGGNCIDSPGIREFGLWHLSANQVASGFREFQPFIQQCRFRDCRHLQEPDCALQAALHSRLISPRRYASFRQIVDHLNDVSVQPQSF